MHKNSVASIAMIIIVIAAAIVTAAGRPALSLLMILSSMYIYQHRE